MGWPILDRYGARISIAIWDGVISGFLLELSGDGEDRPDVGAIARSGFSEVPGHAGLYFMPRPPEGSFGMRDLRDWFPGYNPDTMFNSHIWPDKVEFAIQVVDGAANRVEIPQLSNIADNGGGWCQR